MSLSTRLLTRLYDPLFEPPLRTVRQLVLRLCAEVRPRRVLDVCSGTGTQLRALRNRGYQAWGADLSRDMLGQARRRLPPDAAPLSNARALAYRDGAFDLAIASLALHEKQAPTARAMLHEMVRVVRPGGHLLLADYAPASRASARGRVISFAIERAVGGNHFRNYRAYLAGGALEGLTRDLAVAPVTRVLTAANTVELQLLRRR